MTAARRPEEWLARRGGAVELLRVPAALMHAATALRATLYGRGWLPSARLDVPVVCVGNLTAGGTGKTPLVAWIAAHLVGRGRRPGILSRGYGPRGPGAERGGDEAALLAQALPDVPHVADPDRVAGGVRLVQLGVDVVVLDDGFQHRRLARDVDLVAVDATRPWGLPCTAAGSEPVRALLPRGLLRESPAGLGRAHAVIVTRSDQVDPQALADLAAELHTWAPGAPLLFARHAVRAVRDSTGERRDPAWLAEREVVLVSAIGNPDAFEASVAALGARVVEHRRFRDHHAYDPQDVADLGAGPRPIVTTSKDAVKLEAVGCPVAVLQVELEFVSGQPVLEALLDALPAGPAMQRRQTLHEGLHG